jgi:SNF2 family DNA or RNA helicase
VTSRGHGQVIIGAKGMLELHLRADVRMVARRMFGGSKQTRGDVIAISMTHENARTLKMLMAGFELDVRDDARRVLEDGLVSMEERRRVVESVTRGGDREHITVDLARPARGYQLDVVRMLRATRGLLLADDMGLGKTVSAIACVAGIPEMRPAVVLVPSNLTHQWRRKFREFAPGLVVHVAEKTKPYDITALSAAALKREYNPSASHHPDVLILSYTQIDGWSSILSRPPWRSIVMDEVQALRAGDKTNRYRAVRTVASTVGYRLGLSGTPIYNYAGEIFWVLSAIDPDVLGEREEFAREWCTHDERVNDPEALGARLLESGVMLRRTRRDVGLQLPHVERIVQPVDCSPQSVEDVGGEAAELARLLLSQSGYTSVERMRAASDMMNGLRQATGIGKAPAVAAFVRELVGEGRRVILYGYHRAVYDIWLRSFSDRSHGDPISVRMITGSESPAEKDVSVREFCREGGAKVLIISLRSGAGIDGLQHVCSTVVFGELDWSPKVHDQCVMRVDRDGQTEPVQAFFCASDIGADPIMVQVNGAKRNNSEPVIDPNEARAQRDNAVDTLEELPDDITRRVAQSILSGDYLRPKGQT